METETSFVYTTDNSLANTCKSHADESVNGDDMKY